MFDLSLLVVYICIIIVYCNLVFFYWFICWICWCLFVVEVRSLVFLLWIVREIVEICFFRFLFYQRLIFDVVLMRMSFVIRVSIFCVIQYDQFFSCVNYFLYKCFFFGLWFVQSVLVCKFCIFVIDGLMFYKGLVIVGLKLCYVVVI